MSTTLTLTLDRDDEFELQVLDPAGAPYPLDGCTLALAARLTPDGDELFRLEVGSGLTVSDAATGRVKALFSAAAKATAGLSELVSPYWDFLVVDALGRPLPNESLKGSLVIEPSITQPA